MQRNWIGRSEGAEVDFAVDGHAGIDAARLHDAARHAVRRDVHGARARARARREAHDARAARCRRRVSRGGARKSELERTELQKDKTGVFTGAYAINPATGGKIPIWIADYVLAGYGTGAIMAVPAHDERDFEFAAKFGLPVIRTVQPPADFDGRSAWLGDGIAVNSGVLNGLNAEQAKAAMIEWLEREGKGERRVNYKLRDWLFSRQRYWGEPFPIVFVDGKPQTVRRERAAARLPELEDFKPSGSPEGPLAKAGAWLETVDPKRQARAARPTRCRSGRARAGTTCASSIRRTTSGSSTRSEKTGCRSICTSAARSTPCCTCLYARFWHKVLYDAGVVTTPEPFPKLVHQGMILGELEFTVNGERVGRGARREARRPVRAARPAPTSPSRRAPTR